MANTYSVIEISVNSHSIDGAFIFDTPEDCIKHVVDRTKPLFRYYEAKKRVFFEGEYNYIVLVNGFPESSEVYYYSESLEDGYDSAYEANAVIGRINKEIEEAKVEFAKSVEERTRAENERKLKDVEKSEIAMLKHLKAKYGDV